MITARTAYGMRPLDPRQPQRIPAFRTLLINVRLSVSPFVSAELEPSAYP